MTKTVAYVATAILLGIAAMLPVIVLTPKKAGPGYYASSEEMRLFSKSDVESLPNQGEIGIATVPSGPFHIGLILLLSFVFALGVSFYFRRKIF